MNRYTLLFAGGFVAATVMSTAVRADTLLLENGTRVDGRIVEETADGVTVEVGTEHKQFPHSQIRFVRLSAEIPHSGSSLAAPATQPVGQSPVAVAVIPAPKLGVPNTLPAVIKGKMDPALREQLLNEAVAAYQQNKFDKAVIPLTRLVHGCNSEELEWASLKCQEAVGKPLAQILAEQKFNMAIEVGQGKIIKLSCQREDYEAGALGTLLAGLYNKLVNSLKDFLNDPKMYRGDPKEAVELLPKALLLAATISERLRLDASIVGEAKLELKSMQKNVDILIINLRLRSENKLTEAMKADARLTPTAGPGPQPTPKRGR